MNSATPDPVGYRRCNHRGHGAAGRSTLADGLNVDRMIADPVTAAMAVTLVALRTSIWWSLISSGVLEGTTGEVAEGQTAQLRAF